MGDLAPGEQAVTIVFTDIAGFTHRIQQIEKLAGPAAAVLVKDEHDQILRQNLGGSGYVYVKSTGDGCLFLYKDVCAPLAPLVTTQRAFKAYYEARAELTASRCGFGSAFTRAGSSSKGRPRPNASIRSVTRSTSHSESCLLPPPAPST